MASITPRKRKDGTTAYKAQVKIMRDGKFVFQKTETFDREAAAKGWTAKTEKALAIAKPVRETLADLIGAYVRRNGTKIGRTKAQVLRSIQTHDLAHKAAEDITSKELVEWTRWLGEAGRKPQTVQNYLSHLSAVFNVARTAWGKQINRNVVKDATEASKHFGLVAKSAKRDRRPTIDELNRLLGHFRTTRGMPMGRLLVFAVCGTSTGCPWVDLGG